ncbi:hypothetical protein GCM10011607_12120 [Shewanella inventionis]|uniref:Lipoprotein n=1 Tax=Shewanella inventionis TaxID=1738770 RepID=A0ABQ1IX20_9GAMM|nr:hypothetical protein [Shewanella inventionis]GGB53175.1 hypothetical protein GCM10011607_12120 [Shewanella inventionis]
MFRVVAMFILSVSLSGCISTPKNESQDYFCDSRDKRSAYDLSSERTMYITMRDGDVVIPVMFGNEYRFYTPTGQESCNGWFINDVRKATSIDEKTHSFLIELRDGNSFEINSNHGVLPLSEVHEAHLYNQTKDTFETRVFPLNHFAKLFVVEDHPIPEEIKGRFKVYYDKWVIDDRDRKRALKLKAEQQQAELEERYRIHLEKKRQEELIAREKALANENLILSPAGLGGLVCNDGPLRYRTDAAFNVEQVVHNAQIVATVENVNTESRRIQYKIRSFFADIPSRHDKLRTTGFYYRGILVSQGVINWDSVQGWYPCHD